MKQSLFDSEPISIEQLKIKSKIIHISYDDIIFNPLSQMLCQNCGMFGRTYRCPPFTRSYDRTREYLKQFNKFILIMSESDEEEIQERYNHIREHYKLHEWKSWFYTGTQVNAINTGNVRKDLKIILRFIKSKHEKFEVYDVGGGCLRCRPCKKQLKQSCAHPHESFASPEGSGIDVYTTLRNKEIFVESPPIKKYISIAMICWKE